MTIPNRPDWLQPPPPRRRRGALLVVGGIALAAALVGGVAVAVVVAQDDDDAARVAEPDAVTSTPTATSVGATTDAVDEPDGPDAVIALAEQIATGYNDRDRAALRTATCDPSAMPDDDQLFDFPESVTFSAQGDPEIAGHQATMDIAAEHDESGYRDSITMHFRWDSDRWCLESTS